MSRSSQESGAEFVEVKKCPCTLLLDFDLVFYRQLGLKRSVKNVFEIPTMLTYAERHHAGIPFLKLYADDDLLVMGGDFIVDSSGRLIYAYPSKKYTDRPSVNTLLEVLSTF